MGERGKGGREEVGEREKDEGGREGGREGGGRKKERERGLRREKERVVGGREKNERNMKVCVSQISVLHREVVQGFSFSSSPITSLHPLNSDTLLSAAGKFYSLAIIKSIIRGERVSNSAMFPENTVGKVT